MERVTVGGLRASVDGGAPSISAQVTIAGRRSEVYVRASRGPLAAGAEPFVHVGLLAAMRLGAALHIEGPVSPALLRHLDQIQDILCAWHPALHKASVQAERVTSLAHAPAGQGAGCFFSGGIDSSYTVLKRRAELTDLILVRGFDMRLGNQPLWDLVAPRLRRAAADMGKPLIEVETNVRSVLDTYADWEDLSSGAALAGVALALAPQFERVYIAGAVTYRVLAPLGSHVLLDSLWSTECMEIVHDGCEADRWQKLAALVTSRRALQWLRVCYRNTGLAYNCGRCRKCLSVKCYLKAAGVLDDCPTFDKDIDLDVVAHMPIEALPVLSMRATLLPAVERFGTQPDIVRALRASIEASELAHRTGGDAGALLDAAESVRLLEAQVQGAQDRRDRLSARLNAMQSSRSWRLTAPLRALEQRAQGKPRNG